MDLDSIASFLVHLTRQRSTLREDRAAILAVAGGEGVSKFNFEAVVYDLGAWLQGLEQREPIPQDIRALHFGLYESAGGCSLYVSGFRHFDSSDDHWASNTADWSPIAPSSVSSRLGELFQGLEDEPVPAWAVVQAVATAVLKAVFVW